MGKTSLVDRVLSSLEIPRITINLERDALVRSRIDQTREFAEFEELLRDEFEFDPAVETILFIDEAQESQRLGHYVRFFKESWPATRSILTGSTLRRLFSGEVRYPVGRVRRLRLRPLAFSEFLVALGHNNLAVVLRDGTLPFSAARHERLVNLYDLYLTVGGMPAVVVHHADERGWRRQRTTLVADLEQDFLRLFGPQRLAIVSSCFRSVANYVGSPSKYASVISSPTRSELATIKEVFSRLELWDLVLRSDQHGPSPEASQRFHPKRYLFDTGCLREHREAAVPSISILAKADQSVRRAIGGVLENQTAIEIHDHFDRLDGWKRSSQGLEIDFVVPQAQRTWPLECKATLDVKRTHLRGVLGYLERYDLPAGIVVSLGSWKEFTVRDSRRIINIPAYMLERLPDLLNDL